MGNLTAAAVLLVVPVLGWADDASTTLARDAAGTVTRVVVPGRAPDLRAPEETDPDLEPGFPVQAFHGPGSYHGGPAIHTLVGNIDADPELEILRTALATGPIYAWNHDGTAVSGWPVTTASGAGYVVLGELDPSSPGNEVFSGYWGTPGRLVAWRGDGSVLPSWPRNSANYVATPPALADVTGDGLAEAFLEEEDWQLHGYGSGGSILAGWPVFAGLGTQERHTPAVADLDGDGDLEVVTVTGSSSGGTFMLAYNRDGSAVPGFPVAVPQAYTDTFPAVGDVDGDGAPEIVAATANPADPLTTAVRVYSRAGVLERTIGASTGVAYGTAPALADLDGDGTVDIVVQTDGGLYAWKGDGTVLPGWPQTWSNRWLGESSPVVGDVTGDGKPDIVVTTQVGGSSENGDVRVYSATGVIHPHFPKALPIGGGAVPAIADIDLDGRNEIAVSGSFWNGVTGNYDMVWVYDLGGGPHGAVPWGQFMGNAAHTGSFGTLAAGLDVDAAGNHVFEPGETVTVAPAWHNFSAGVLSIAGSASAFTGPAPGTYSVVDGSAVYGAVPPGATATCATGGDCYSLSAGAPSGRPAVHWDAAFDERLAMGSLSKRWVVHIGDSFADVPRANPFYQFVETLLHRGVTGGCGANAYCPADSTTREQMAVFVLTAKEGPGFAPPACTTPMFGDVPAASPYCRWIEELARRGVVTGCGGGNYCPTQAVSREQMAVFVLRTLDPALNPPACGTPVFGDVPATSPFCRWIEELVRRGVVTGCGGGNYCPAGPVTREQMGAFLTVTFGLTLYGV